jgi:hypothetical protein
MLYGSLRNPITAKKTSQCTRWMRLSSHTLSQNERSLLLHCTRNSIQECLVLSRKWGLLLGLDASACSIQSDPGRRETDQVNPIEKDPKPEQRRQRREGPMSFISTYHQNSKRQEMNLPSSRSCLRGRPGIQGRRLQAGRPPELGQAQWWGWRRQTIQN